MNAVIVYLFSLAIMVFLLEIVPFNLAHTKRPHRSYRIAQIVFFVLLTLGLLLRFLLIILKKRAQNIQRDSVREEQLTIETAVSPKAGKTFNVKLMLSNFDRW